MGKAAFYSLYDEHKAKVSGRKKRDVMDMSMEKSQDLTLPPPPHPYNFHPFLGLGGVKPEDSENELYKYVPYYGFVPAEGKADKEDPEAEGEDEEKEEILYKYDPLYGFVKADDEIKPLEEQEYKYTPYVGFVPATGDEDEDVKTYKFNPFYGFVEKTDEDNEETAEEMSEQQYKFVPFYGFVPVNEDGEVEETAKNYGNLKYTFHPYYGFLPTPTDGEVEQQLYKLDPELDFIHLKKKILKKLSSMLKERKETPNFSLILFIILYNRLFMFLLFQQKLGCKQEKLPKKLQKLYLVLLYPYTQGQQGQLLPLHFLETNSCFVIR